MIKKTFLALLIVSNCFYSMPSMADDMDLEADEPVGMIGVNNTNPNLIFVEPAVANVVIPKYFGHIVSSSKYPFKEGITDESVLNDVLNTYINMLMQNGGLVSISGLQDVCFSAYKNIDVKVWAQFELKLQMHAQCTEFARALFSTTVEPEEGCPYNVKKEGSQKRIKYTRVDGAGGFIRKNGTIAWRFFNPGCLRRSSLQCTTIKTNPNGTFAVFDSYETGHLALYTLLTTTYKNTTVRNTMYKYAPPSQNNTAGYIRSLQRAGINVDKKLSTLTPDQLNTLMHQIETVEGWKDSGVGEIVEF